MPGAQSYKRRRQLPPDDPTTAKRRPRKPTKKGTGAPIVPFAEAQANTEPLPPPKGWFQTFEELFTSEEGFGLTTATVLQRAICKIIQGLPFSAHEANAASVRRSLGGRRWRNPSMIKSQLKQRANRKTKRPLGPVAAARIIPEIMIVAGIRGAKSMFGAALAVWASQIARLPPEIIKDGEIPRFIIFSLSLDNARVVIGHLAGALAKPKLRPLLLDKAAIRLLPDHWKLALEESTDDTVVGRFVLRHPSGRPMEIRVVAGKRAGASGLSRWLFGVCADEATRMSGATDAVVNYDHMRDAIQGRLLPGAQFLTIGSPWQSDGPVYEAFQQDFGRNNPDRIILVAAGPDMNPYWWTPERCRALQRKNPQAYITDVLGRFADAEQGLVPNAVIEACTRKSPLHIDFEPGHDYRAAMDPGVRTNAWTLVICDCIRKQIAKGVFIKLKRVVFHTEWRGTSAAPLSPKAVLAECAEILKAYELFWAYTDQYAAEANIDLAAEFGLQLVVDDWTAQNKATCALNLQAQMSAGLIEIPDDVQFRRDIRLVKRKAIAKGVQIIMPQTPDGRHCDFFPPLMKAMNEWIREDQPVEPSPGDAGYGNHLDKIAEEQEAEEVQNKSESILYPYGDDDTQLDGESW